MDTGHDWHYEVREVGGRPLLRTFTLREARAFALDVEAVEIHRMRRYAFQLDPKVPRTLDDLLPELYWRPPRLGRDDDYEYGSEPF